MRKRKNNRKKNNRNIETHTWLRGARRRGFSQRLETPTRLPTSAEHPRTSRCTVANAAMIKAARNEL
jgi:hypothetical protein